MSKRGLSVDEKRRRLLQLFFEKKDFFQLKELEKLAPKEKGITQQSVKDILQSLVDDGMVDSDRIGTSNYFWALPSKAANTRKRKLSSVKEQSEQLRKKQKLVEGKITDMSAGREDSAKRTKLLEDLAEKQACHQQLKEELQRYHDCDPVVLEQKREESACLKESANRWTDNIFSIKSWCKNRFGMEESVLNKHFDIPAELDYIE